MLKDIIVLALVSWLIYLVLNRYILPIFRITSVASSSMRKMQEQMQEMQNRMNQQQPTQKKKVEKEGDYIDYEEVR